MEYISLKEAAKISGYAPDYIGQLIRSGKLPGKQVYTNIAWVTTEESIRAYMLQKESGGLKPSSDYKYYKLEQRYQLLTKILLYGIAVVLIIFTLILLYALSVRFDGKVSQQALQKLQSQQQK